MSAPIAAPTYEALRAMRGRGVGTQPSDLVVGHVVRVDAMKYRVMEAPRTVETGSVLVDVYSEDNQFDVLSLSAKSPIKVIGNLP